MLERARLAAGEATLPQLLREHARAHPEQTALREKKHGIWQGLSWGQYYERARRVALALTRLGLGAGDRIIVASENTPEWFIADIGAQMIGVQVVGIYPTNPWLELQYIARHCRARLAVTGDQEQTDKVLDAMKNGDGLPALEHLYCVDLKGLQRYEEGRPGRFANLLELGRSVEAEDPAAGASLDAAIDALRPDDVNILVYTSGTTGPPKGAMLTHRNLVYSAHAYAEAVAMLDKPFDAVGYLPLCHVAERCYSAVQHLVLGGRMNFAESIDTVASNIREIAPTYFLGVPRIWEKLQQHFEFRMKDSGRLQRALYAWGMRRGRVLSLARAERAGPAPLSDRLMVALLYVLLFRNMQRHMGLNRTHTRMCGGASVSPETLRFFDIIGLTIGQGYGLTESGGLCFVQRPERRNVPGQCGPALPGTEWRLAADQEVMVRSPGVFSGYLFDEKATADVLKEGWLATGDIAEVKEGDEIVIVDRKKAIIITSGGKNIAPSELENALKDSPFIKEAIVVGEGRKFLGALVQIDFDNVGRWAGERDLSYTSYKSLTQVPEVAELVQGVVDAVNGRFARVENVRRFVLLEKELDHDDGELTATQKVRRGMIQQKFASELERIYGAQV